MLFSSLEFLYLFLPVCLLIYFCVPFRVKNLVLLFFSLIFYGWGEPGMVFLMVFTIAADYFFGMMIERSNDPKAKKIWLVITIAFNLLILGFFKYYDFVIDNIRAITQISSIKSLGLSLPIGISFYTFQAMSYVIDVYRGDTKAQKNIISFGTYVTLFPQLIAGPIVRYRDIDLQLEERTHSLVMAASGVRTFVAGLAKKVILANTAGAMWEYFRLCPDGERTVVGAWIGIIFYTLQIYFDFSGYSDMAIGLGKIFGFRFLENFNYPYVAESITDFWRRWHISLSSWFREYVYIPLGGNRCSKNRMFFNLFTVWFLTGFWHGASWNYIIWGLYYFVLLMLEKMLFGKLDVKIPRVIGRVYTLVFVVIGWLIFVFEDQAAGLEYLKTMFGGGAGLINQLDVYEISRNALFLAISVIAAIPAPRKLFWRLYEKYRVTQYAAIVLCLGGLVVCTAYLVDSSYNPFLYFRF